MVYHEHDSPSHAVPLGTGARVSGSKSSLFLRWLLWSRKHVARQADLCILPNEERKDHFVKETSTQREVLCVWNCPSRDEILGSREPFNKKELRMIYHGSIVPDRLPMSILNAMAAIPKRVNLRLIGYETVGSMGYVQKIKMKAKDLGIEDQIEYLGTVATRRQVLKFCGECDIGIALMLKAAGFVY